jgi:hypothetical protein
MPHCPDHSRAELKALAGSGNLLTVEIDGQTFDVSKSEIVEQP